MVDENSILKQKYICDFDLSKLLDYPGILFKYIPSLYIPQLKTLTNNFINYFSPSTVKDAIVNLPIESKCCYLLNSFNFKDDYDTIYYYYTQNIEDPIVHGLQLEGIVKLFKSNPQIEYLDYLWFILDSIVTLSFTVREIITTM